jgi:hypothetical protein
MKILPKILLLVALLASLALGGIYAANNGKLNSPIRHVVQYLLLKQGVSAKFIDFDFKNSTLTASQLKLKLGSSTGIINDFSIKMNFAGWFSEAKLFLEVPSLNLALWDKNGEQIFQTEISAKASVPVFWGRRNFDLVLNDIKLPNIKDIEGKKLPVGKARYVSVKSPFVDKEQFDLNFGESVYLNLKNWNQNKNKLQLRANNLPFMIYKFAANILEDSELVDFCAEFIKDGYVQDLNIVFDPNGSSNDLFGSGKIRKLDFLYDPDYPILKDVGLDFEIKGSKFKFDIKNGYSSDVLLSEGVMFMDWQGRDDTLLTLNTKGYGSVKSLVDFISQDQKNAMKKANIDIEKAKGSVEVEASIEIPLKRGTENIYDIKANIPDLALDIFKNNVHLRGGNISGVFDGNKLTLGGEGEINGFNSDINFIYNIKDTSKFDHKLDIKTRFKTIPRKDRRSTKIGFISLLGGDSIIDIEYVNKNSQGEILVDADISELDLYFDKLGIRKKKNQQARVVIRGSFSDPTEGNLDFSVKGENDIKINGDVIFKEEAVQVNISEIKTKGTDLSASLIESKGMVVIDLKGKSLDLSDADMLQFLEKERDEGATKLSLNIKKIRLKNDIWLDNLDLKLECDKERCFSGYMNSKLGERLVEMLLTANVAQENWLIKTGNAGALFKGIGIYDTMKSGSLTLNINTSRREVKSGQIIPILDGSFELDRFIVSKTSMMSQLVSFTSFPGLLNIIRGSNSISFSDMSGNFSFDNDVLKIKNSAARGPYFNFNMYGDIDIQKRQVNLKGHVTPELYGISSAVSYIPVVGRILTGNKKHRGIIAAPYHIKEKY